MTEEQLVTKPSEIPQHYVNGFQLSLSNADVTALFLQNGVPALGLSMSFTTSKTLASALNELMSVLEGVTGRNIMTTQEVSEGLLKISGEKQGQKNA